MKARSSIWALPGALCVWLAACAVVAGPHRIEVSGEDGVRVVQIRGYGLNTLSAGPWNSLHLGSSKHCLVFEDVAGDELAWERTSGFGLVHRLPGQSPLHVSTESTGLDLNVTPTSRGLALGRQFSSATRLPVNRSLRWLHRPPEAAASDPSFRLQSIP